jgi:hypothetical protein
MTLQRMLGSLRLALAPAAPALAQDLVIGVAAPRPSPPPGRSPA